MGEYQKLIAAIDGDAAAAVSEAVAAGDYACEEDVVRDAFRLWHEARDAEIARLRTAWDEGIASGDPLEGGFDPDDVKRRGRERLARLRND